MRRGDFKNSIGIVFTAIILLGLFFLLSLAVDSLIGNNTVKNNGWIIENTENITVYEKDVQLELYPYYRTGIDARNLGFERILSGDSCVYKSYVFELQGYSINSNELPKDVVIRYYDGLLVIKNEDGIEKNLTVKVSGIIKVFTTLDYGMDNWRC